MILISFRYLNVALQGEQRAYISAHDANGSWLNVFLLGGGYLWATTKTCATGDGPARLKDADVRLIKLKFFEIMRFKNIWCI